MGVWAFRRRGQDGAHGTRSIGWLGLIKQADAKVPKLLAE
jgi:hypothetical protein